MIITRKSNIAEIVKKYPETQKVFLDYGLHCVGCFASNFDTIEAGANAHGFDNKAINDLVSDINKYINKDS